jgi:predicted transcriptional regulator
MTEERVTLLSVRPQYATALLEGSKTVEVRRRRAHIAAGEVCLLYASSPTRALVGAIRVAHTDTGTPEQIWSRWGDQTGLERQEFDSYLDGSTEACAIVVDHAAALDETIALQELRRRREGFITPQSYCFLSASDCEALLGGLELVQSA